MKPVPPRTHKAYSIYGAAHFRNAAYTASQVRWGSKDCSGRRLEGRAGDGIGLTCLAARTPAMKIKRQSPSAEVPAKLALR